MIPFMLLLFQFLLALLCIHSSRAADLVFDICSNDSILDSSFHTNLKSLLPYLPTNASSSSNYFNTSAGKGSGRKVYVQALCRGDVNASACNNCLQSLTTRDMDRCPNASDAAIFYELCQVRYSTKDFFSRMDYAGKFPNWNTTRQEVAAPEVFKEKLNELFSSLSDKAIYDPNMFSAGKLRGIGKDKATLYGLVQCTKDLSRDTCSKCLNNAKGDIQGYFDKNYTSGGIVFAQSCSMRYELYQFFAQVRTNGKKRNLTKVAVISSASVVVVVALSASWCYFKWKRSRHKDEERSEHAFLDDSIPSILLGTSNHWANQTDSQDQLNLMKLRDIKVATDDFSDSNQLGQGGFGIVYKGTFRDGKQVAVKRLLKKSWQGLDEFKNEIILIAGLQHRNLVRLLGCCLEGEEKLLIYEFMPNRSLDMILFDKSRRPQLNWNISYNIIIGIARGLLYLHEDSRLRVIHRDLKPNNVLLDSEMNAKISDFGMARIFGENQNQANTRRIVGTHGYMAPEYAMEGLFSVKSDVYSFGIVLLEIISGKRWSGFYPNEQSQSLAFHAWQLWNTGRAMDFIDPILVNTCSEKEVLRCIHVGLLCVQQDAADRPTMSSVLFILGTESVELAQPTQPAFSVGKKFAKSIPSSSSTNDSVNKMTLSNVLAR